MRNELRPKNGRPSALAPVLMLAAFAVSSCDRSQGGSTTAALPQPSSTGMEPISAVPLGVSVGAVQSTAAAATPNPYADSAQAVQQGHELYIRMNCAGCHGYQGQGGMGPNLADTYWRYGGTPVMIFKSIYEGRPQGMPAWNPALPPDEIWKLTAFIQSLGGAYTAAQTEASLQGDRVGDNVAAGVEPTLAGAAAASGPSGSGGTSHSGQPTDARPDAGGAPPGSKP